MQQTARTRCLQRLIVLKRLPCLRFLREQCSPVARCLYGGKTRALAACPAMAYQEGELAKTRMENPPTCGPSRLPRSGLSVWWICGIAGSGLVMR
jgi:Cys-rich Gliadin N-terminal